YSKPAGQFIIRNKSFRKDRALFSKENIHVVESEFLEGEVALKEGKNLLIEKCKFKSNYPLWYNKGTVVKDSEFLKECRSSVWYGKEMDFEKCIIKGPKFLRESRNIIIKNTNVIGSDECSWWCEDLTINKSLFQGDYFGLGSKNLNIKNSEIKGKYPLQHIKGISYLKNVKIIGKDAFWDSKNIVIQKCVIKGPYAGWNSENLTFIDSTIIGSQPLCYSKNIILINTELEQAKGAFEFSTVYSID
ncbi:DUF3737 family protein, partial [Candidatus Woesearchaeota archaeon]|nr:DUF3737 family protein [Candidatus Woesearchaeota archaeon]